MSNNQKSRFMEVIDYFDNEDIREVTAALRTATGIVEARVALNAEGHLQIPNPRRRGRRPGSKNRLAEETQAAAD